MTKLNLEELSNILAESEILTTTNHSGMLIHEIIHPIHKNAIAVQGNDGCLLIARQ